MGKMITMVLAGQVNTGKSTMFNYLTRSRSALVGPWPGLTRDRQYAVVSQSSKAKFMIIDTPGFFNNDLPDDLDNNQIESQLEIAFQEADLILFFVNAQTGLSRTDTLIAKELRGFNCRTMLVINKIDHAQESSINEFFELGFSEARKISLRSKIGLQQLKQRLSQIAEEAGQEEEYPLSKAPKIALIGRPNVGKSTLANYLIGSQRMLVGSRPHTTRDSVESPIELGKHSYTLIDTAGIRRRTRIKNQIEHSATIESILTIARADLILYLFDSLDGITDQDLRLLRLVIDSGRALVLGLSKWDLIPEERRSVYLRRIKSELSHLSFLRLLPLSTEKEIGFNKIGRYLYEAYRNSQKRISSHQLSELLQTAQKEHKAPAKIGTRLNIRLKYAHQEEGEPGSIIIHGNSNARHLQKSYLQYLRNFFQRSLKLWGIVLRIKLSEKTLSAPDRRSSVAREII